MGAKLEQLSVAVSKNHQLAEKLDQVLTGPNDRAFVVCDYGDCTNNYRGRCTIYTIQNVPRMKASGPCTSYVPSFP